MFDDLGNPVPFGERRRLPSPVNTGGYEVSPFVTSDWPAQGSSLYFVIFSGNADIYRSRWIPEHLHFKRGDADPNGAIEVTDAIVTLGHLFLGDPKTFACRDAADTNDDGLLDVSDPVATLIHIFLGNFTISAPGPTACGPDPTADENDADLGCEEYSPEACRQ